MSEVEDKLRDLHVALDAAVQRAIRGRPVSCTKGCTHCCYQLVACGIGEALVIAAHVARQANWRDIATRLAVAAMEQVGTDKRQWFARHVPCPFLDGDLCSIYELRPGACRWHYVSSPPENCALGAADPHTARYDSREAFEHLARFDVAIFAENPRLGPPCYGLLPHMVLYALQFCVPGGDRRWVEKRLAKLPTPQRWAEEHAAGRGAKPMFPIFGDDGE